MKINWKRKKMMWANIDLKLVWKSMYQFMIKIVNTEQTIMSSQTCKGKKFSS